MCGIAGVYGLEKIDDKKKVANILTTNLTHRGPDAANTFIDQNVILAHTRLSVLDTNVRSNQPFIDSSNRYVLVFNGELYNYNTVKQELNTFPFKTTSDTEVLLAAWIKWGVDCIHRFNGMFAFSVWDSVKKELFVVRDRIGIKPVYYYEGNDNFVFSSEIRAMLKSGLVPKKIEKNNLSEYLKYQTVHAPRTILKDVFMIPSGTYLKISDGEVFQHTYWKAENQVKFEKNDQKSVKKQTKDLLIDSVEKRMISDVNIGAFLSGGIDSSLLVGIIREELKLPIDTFSITFSEKEFSEAKYSQQVAKHFNTNHHEIELSSNDFKSKIVSALKSMDHPSGDGPNSYVVSEAVKQEGLTVALSGLGGDELFAGYPFFKQYLELQQKKYILSFPLFVRKIMGLIASRLKPGVTGQKIAETLQLPYFDLAYTYPINRRVLSQKRINSLLRTTASNDILAEEINDLFTFKTNGNRLPDLSKISLVELTTYMQNVLLRDADQMSMSHALEIRVPFLDHRLVAHCLSISDNLKFPNYPKSLLVESFEGLLPNEIVHRKKMGFVLPWESWLRKDLKDVVDQSFDYLKSTEYFNANYLQNLLLDFNTHKKDINWVRIWHIVALGFWMKENEIS